MDKNNFSCWWQVIVLLAFFPKIGIAVVANEITSTDSTALNLGTVSSPVKFSFASVTITDSSKVFFCLSISKYGNCTAQAACSAYLMSTSQNKCIGL